MAGWGLCAECPQGFCTDRCAGMARRRCVLGYILVRVSFIFWRPLQHPALTAFTARKRNPQLVVVTLCAAWKAPTLAQRQERCQHVCIEAKGFVATTAFVDSMDYPLAESLRLGNQAPGMGLPAPEWVEILPFPPARAGPFPMTVTFAPPSGANRHPCCREKPSARCNHGFGGPYHYLTAHGLRAIILPILERGSGNAKTTR